MEEIDLDGILNTDREYLKPAKNIITINFTEICILSDLIRRTIFKCIYSRYVFTDIEIREIS